MAGAAALMLFVRWWQRDLPARVALGHVALALLFWSPGLLTDRHQVATDIAYRVLPSRAGIGREHRPANELRSLALAPLLAFALVAPALLPVLELLPRSERAAVLAQAPHAVDPPPFEPRILALALDPLYLASPRERSWKGPSNLHQQTSLHTGASTLALALAGTLALVAAMGQPLALELLASLPVIGHAWARLGLMVDARHQGGLIASSVSWDPGWRLEIDGEPRPATATSDGAFLGFEAPPGRHRATLDYAPRSWRHGLALAALALLVVGASEIVRRRTRIQGPVEDQAERSPDSKPSAKISDAKQL